MTQTPVITVDGPSGSGKGSLCQMLARELGWHLLDSGALYRIVGLAAQKNGVSFDDDSALAQLAVQLNVEFRPGKAGEPAAVILDDEDISDQVRAETTGALASKVAIHNGVREALKELQRSFAKAPGLVADGRDMGTVIFTEAPLKIYLTASAAERADRRYKQLLAKGESVNLAALLEDIQLRDERDMNRAVAPLKPADDAIIIDSTAIAIEDVFQQVLAEVVAIR
ncbi:(d)CMP kinase [Oceanicoccus sp. KOV_DT_Chl]|uniref:(d)CMP kinase n=1 Tax=Oceanicoccus sp. KOV_DT_Chl TaxID=1904639 RepID=UPI000C7D3B67|nr:(d)CMP kinase [Oceanicoccus sp. KOV_DT_Chl]